MSSSSPVPLLILFILDSENRNNAYSLSELGTNSSVGSIAHTGLLLQSGDLFLFSQRLTNN